MKIQTITLNLEGKSDGDLEQALDEAIRRIRDGCTGGSDSNNSGSFSFDVKSEVRFIESDDISDEAKHIADQILAGCTNEVDLEQSLVDFAKFSDGLDLDEFNGFIEGDIASMIQVMIDELGGLDSRQDEDVVEKLNECFNCTPLITTLRDVHESACSGCDNKAESVIGCPDGAELCQQCFNAGSH